jgi:hypothetical protein
LCRLSGTSDGVVTDATPSNGSAADPSMHTDLGKTVFQIVPLTLQDRRKHVYIAGKTG